MNWFYYNKITSLKLIKLWVNFAYLFYVYSKFQIFFISLKLSACFCWVILHRRTLMKLLINKSACLHFLFFNLIYLVLFNKTNTIPYQNRASLNIKTLHTVEYFKKVSDTRLFTMNSLNTEAFFNVIFSCFF